MNKAIIAAFKRHLPTVLAVLGSVGVVATAVAASKNTAQAIKKLDRKQSAENREFTTKEKVICIAPKYIATVAIGAGTITCIVASNILNKKARASVIAAYALLTEHFKEYREAATDVFGEDANDKIEMEIAKKRYVYSECMIGTAEVYDPDSDEAEDVLFYDMIGHRYFRSKYGSVITALYHFNRNYTGRGYATVNELYSFLGLGEIDSGDILGWSQESGFWWIDFDICKTKLEDGLECFTLAPMLEAEIIEEW